MVTARYDQVAGSYASGEDDLSTPAIAALLDLVGPVRGHRALDLACGHGLVARELARRGARVVGLDISKELIVRARSIELATRLGIEYEHGDAAASEVLLDAEFDVIACNFGLSDIDDLEGVCATVARTLVPGGRVVFSILHPCFAGSANVSGSWPSNRTYYDEGWWRADGELSVLRREVGANHRMLSTYVNTLVQAGLRLEAMVEPQPEVSWTAGRPDAALQPVYLVMSCRLPVS